MDILRSIPDVLGSEALDRTILMRTAKLQALCEEAMADCALLTDRPGKMVELHNAEGYMSAAEEGED